MRSTNARQTKIQLSVDTQTTSKKTKKWLRGVNYRLKADTRPGTWYARKFLGRKASTALSTKLQPKNKHIEACIEQITQKDCETIVAASEEIVAASALGCIKINPVFEMAVNVQVSGKVFQKVTESTNLTLSLGFGGVGVAVQTTLAALLGCFRRPDRGTVLNGIMERTHELWFDKGGPKEAKELEAGSSELKEGKAKDYIRRLLSYKYIEINEEHVLVHSQHGNNFSEIWDLSWGNSPSNSLLKYCAVLTEVPIAISVQNMNLDGGVYYQILTRNDKDKGEDLQRRKRQMVIGYSKNHPQRSEDPLIIANFLYANRDGGNIACWLAAIIPSGLDEWLGQQQHKATRSTDLLICSMPTLLQLLLSVVSSLRFVKIKLTHKQMVIELTKGNGEGPTEKTLKLHGFGHVHVTSKAAYIGEPNSVSIMACNRENKKNMKLYLWGIRTLH